MQSLMKEYSDDFAYILYYEKKGTKYIVEGLYARYPEDIKKKLASNKWKIDKDSTIAAEVLGRTEDLFCIRRTKAQ